MPLPDPVLPATKSGAEVVYLHHQVQGNGREHQGGKDSHEHSRSIRRCGAREGWRANVAVRLHLRTVGMNCDEPHTARDELQHRNAHG